MHQHVIGVFDSGFGGLTVVSALQRALPHMDIIYFGDTGRAPYGGRSSETLLEFGQQNIAFLESLHVKTIVAACGTISSVALPQLKRNAKTPLFGIIEAGAKKAVEATKEKRIGVIATQASIDTGAYQAEIYAANPEIKITAVACPKFVPLVESGATTKEHPDVQAAILEYLSVMQREEVDTLLLGCTHYPLLWDAIAAYMGPQVSMVDAGAAAVVQLTKHLENEQRQAAAGTGKVLYYTSGNAGSFKETAGRILGKELSGEVRELTPFSIS